MSLNSLVKKQKFRKTKSTIMIEGKRDSETGERDYGEGTPWLTEEMKGGG